MIARILMFILFSVLFGSISFTQTEKDTTIALEQEFEEFRYIPNYKSKYAAALRRVKKVYPLALHAKHIVDSLNIELASTDKKRKQKKYARKTHKALKADFKFLLKELYVAEGKVLAKLINRETGYTIFELIKTYKGAGEANLYAGIAQAFDQDLKSTYDPIYEDYVIERVIENIEAGIEPFDPTFQIVDKAHYKADRSEYKARIKKNKHQRKAREKADKKKMKD